MPTPLTPELSVEQKKVLSKASHQAIQDHLKALSQASSGKRHWLPPGNRYVSDMAQTLLGDFRMNTCNDRELAEYTAVSTILHTADGWAFLGRALDCNSHGDRYTACHLAYYAELRAAMALLASAGICIGNSCHAAITSSPTRCIPIKDIGSTHRAVWMALGHWSTTPYAASLVSAVISPESIPLSDWLHAVSAGVSVQHLANNWVGAWGLDLERLFGDRDARNEASYRPTRLSKPKSVGVVENGSLVTEIWRLFEPSESGEFGLDRHLLRQCLQATFVPDTTPPNAPDRFRTQVEKALRDLGFREKSLEHWLAFLCAKSEPTELVERALSRVELADPTHHLCVISRATILLRLATGACRSLLRSASIGREDIAFWWRPLGLECGYWPEGNDPDSCADLWQDIEEEMGLLDPGQSSDPAADTSLWEWRRRNRNAIALLGECERIALWGLGL